MTNEEKSQSLSAFRTSETSRIRKSRIQSLNMIEYQHRIRTMPQMMDRMFYLIQGFLCGNAPEWLFRETYLDDAIPLYKRISFGKDCEAYRESYAREIELLHQISALCDGPENQLYDMVFEAVKRYLEKDVKRGRCSLI